MSPIVVVAKLRKLGCIAAEHDGQLVLRTFKKGVTVPIEALELARANRDAIQRWLDRSSCSHLPPFHHAKERKVKGRPGWVRSDCEKCGRFIGYRQLDHGEAEPKPLPKPLEKIPGVVTAATFAKGRELASTVK